MSWGHLALVACFLCTGCILTFPTTSSFQHTLPSQGTTIAIVGGTEASRAITANWLQRRGLKIVERRALQQIWNEQKVRLVYATDLPAELRKMEQFVGVRQLIVLEHAEPPLTNSVSIRAVNIETGEVEWSASAYWPDKPLLNDDEQLVRLTCQALATAWGYREPGNRWILSDGMCAL